MGEIVLTMNTANDQTRQETVARLQHLIPDIEAVIPDPERPIAEVGLARSAVERLLPLLLSEDPPTREVVARVLDWLAGFEPDLGNPPAKCRRDRLKNLAGLYGANYACALEVEPGTQAVAAVKVQISTELDRVTGGHDGIELPGPPAGTVFRGYLYSGKNNEPPSEVFAHVHDGGPLDFSTDITIPAEPDKLRDGASVVVFEDRTIISRLGPIGSPTASRNVELR
jgi:hypothetical protein